MSQALEQAISLVSRRSSALADTLILDEDGIYDPSHFNDRLLLGLKGTMSEAELHLLRARLIGGQLNKARRGELWIKPPIGFVYDGSGHVVFDPDQQIQQAVRLLFEMFRRTGSAMRVVHHFSTEGVLWPRRIATGVHAGEVMFAPLDHSRVLGILHNPRYTGAFVYGRTRQRKVALGGGSASSKAPQRSVRDRTLRTIEMICREGYRNCCRVLTASSPMGFSILVPPAPAQTGQNGSVSRRP